MFGVTTFGRSAFGASVLGTVSVTPIVPIRVTIRSLTDEQILSSIRDDYIWFEVYRAYDYDTHLTSVSTVAELDRIISLAQSMRRRDRVWLVISQTWCESRAFPTTIDDLLRTKELFTPLWASESLPL